MEFDIEDVIAYLIDKKAVPDRLCGNCFAELRRSGKFDSPYHEDRAFPSFQVKVSNKDNEVEVTFGLNWERRVANGNFAKFKIDKGKLVLISEGFYRT